MTSLSTARALLSAVAVACAAVVVSASAAYAETGLAGAWSGTGSVMLPSGATEKARCKVSFNKAGGTKYGMNAVCASSSARVAQTATLAQVGPNKFAGDFTNQEYGVSGTISVTLNGSSLFANLSGGGGTAVFNLRR
jgi:hypothetical protein